MKLTRVIFHDTTAAAVYAFLAGLNLKDAVLERNRLDLLLCAAWLLWTVVYVRRQVRLHACPGCLKQVASKVGYQCPIHDHEGEGAP